MIKISYYMLERVKSDVSFFANSRKEKEAIFTREWITSTYLYSAKHSHDDLLNAPTTALIVAGKFLPRLASDFTHVALAFDLVALPQ